MAAGKQIMRLKEPNDEITDALLLEFGATLKTKGEEIPDAEFEQLLASFTSKLDIEIERNIFTQLVYEHFVVTSPAPLAAPQPAVLDVDFPEYRTLLNALPERLWVCYDRVLHDMVARLAAAVGERDLTTVRNVAKTITTYEFEFDETSSQFLETALFILKTKVACRASSVWQEAVFNAESAVFNAESAVFNAESSIFAEETLPS